jgi:predicted secreted protein
MESYENKKREKFRKEIEALLEGERSSKRVRSNIDIKYNTNINTSSTSSTSASTANIATIEGICK